ncbi:MAG TPA: DUF72 domain-containing protein [Stellaceae bacterium]|nr:DUF72 domain-containing protein [Stellaceae bacterium]
MIGEAGASQPPTRLGQVRIGVSGWRYAGWRGRFYPPRLRQRDELSYAARCFDTIEINGTHYSLQRPRSFAQWHAETPAGFVFAVKGSRFITHMKQLRDIEAPLANFFAQGVLLLGDKLGPILWQFSPRFHFNAEKLDAFFALLPQDGEAAAALARRHDHRLAGRAATEGRVGKLRHAVEIRHRSFLDPAFVALLRRRGIALVFADAVDWPYAEDVTADFVYMRLHGSQELYASGYDDAALDRCAARIRAWHRGGEPADAQLIDGAIRPERRPRDVYVYFDNDAKVRAPFDARTLRDKLGAG